MLVTKNASHGGTSARWISVGSIKPDDASKPVWARSKAVSLSVRKLLHEAIDAIQPYPSRDPLYRTGLIISFEAPTPGNDFLTSISRILHLTLLDEATHGGNFRKIFVQQTNASTLRSLMGLTKSGNANKTENVAKAYEYLDQQMYPNLDTDACDAVLMAMMARYSAALLLGHPENLPHRFLVAMTNATEEVVGKGRNARTRTKGLLHRPEYWRGYERERYSVSLRDAASSVSEQISTVPKDIRGPPSASCATARKKPRTRNRGHAIDYSNSVKLAGTDRRDHDPGSARLPGWTRAHPDHRHHPAVRQLLGRD
jgi:hypothetical protein